jgi:SAM-dependent methyltransferase
VVAIEPSRTMIDQRRHGSAPAVQGVAEALPVVDGAFDAAMAVMTVHHWPDPVAGLAELQRVAHRQVVLTFDFSAHDEMWWISEYLTEIAADWEHNAPVVSITDALDGRSETIPMPWDCTDGMLIAYWRRPERYLDPEVLASASGTALADPVLLARAVQRLSADLDSGAWRRRHADLLDRDELDVGVRLIVAEH